MKTQIDNSELKKLRNAAAKLAALEAGGVDNWDFYDESLKEYRATIEKGEKIEALLDELCAILCEGTYEPSERGGGFAFTAEVEEKALALLNDQIVQLKD